MSELIAQNIFSTVKTALGPGAVPTPVNIVMIAARSMEVVEKVSGLTGPEKKAIVLRAIRLFVEDAVVDEDAERAILLLLDTALPSMIDMLVSAYRGAIKLGSKHKFLCCK